jgi:hypothetical protein
LAMLLVGGPWFEGLRSSTANRSFEPHTPPAPLASRGGQGGVLTLGSCNGRLWRTTECGARSTGSRQPVHRALALQPARAASVAHLGLSASAHGAPRRTGVLSAPMTGLPGNRRFWRGPFLRSFASLWVCVRQPGRPVLALQPGRAAIAPRLGLSASARRGSCLCRAREGRGVAW